MADFAAQRVLGTDQTFVGRVTMAAFQEADRVSDELPATAHHEKRVNYATLFVRVPDTEGAKLALACAAHGQILGDPANATDAKIIVALRDYWNVFAGVITTP